MPLTIIPVASVKSGSININGPWRDSFPSNMQGPPDRESLDSMLANEFLNFSFQERNEISEEVHGVSCCSPTETPKLITISLEQLDFELGMIPTNEKKMYALSQTIYGRKNSSEKGGSYVNDSEFRLRFLRCVLFDARMAAQRLVSFLAIICDLFGEYALKRPILLSDFTEEELHIFRMGNLQLLPFRDRSGRRIIAGVEGLAIQFDSNLRVCIVFFVQCFVFLSHCFLFFPPLSMSREQ